MTYQLGRMVVFEDLVSGVGDAIPCLEVMFSFHAMQKRIGAIMIHARNVAATMRSCVIKHRDDVGRTF